METLVIGLDGAEPSLVERWQRDLPSLASLRAEGAWGLLNSTIPPVTGPAWTTFATGMNPGKHGYFSFGQHKPGTYDFQPGTVGATRGRSLWEILSAAGRRVGVVAVPGAYPPAEVNGVVVGGFGTPSETSAYTYPAELKRTLTERFGYRACEDPGFSALPDEEKLRVVYQALDRQLAVCEWLLAEQGFDFFATVFRAADLVQHFFWADMDASHPVSSQRVKSDRLERAVHEAYVRLDEVVGRLLVFRQPRTHVIVLSDHGFGAHYGTVTLNRWLERHGYLEVRGYRRSRLGTLGRAANLIELLGLDQQDVCRIAEWLWHRGLHGTRVGADLSNIAKNFHCYFGAVSVDWERTTAYSAGQDAVYLNMQGREPLGVVKRGAESEAILSRLQTELLDLLHPQTGAQLIHTVRRKEEVYSGAHLEDAPDLVLSLEPGYKTAPNFERALLARPSCGRTGDHRQDGVLLLAGPGVGARLEIRADLQDVAPTLLHLSGQPVPSDMDGRVLTTIIAAGSPADRTVAYSQGMPGSARETSYADALLTAEEEEQIAAHLRGLGYL